MCQSSSKLGNFSKVNKNLRRTNLQQQYVFFFEENLLQDSKNGLKTSGTFSRKIFISIIIHIRCTPTSI